MQRKHVLGLGIGALALAALAGAAQAAVIAVPNGDFLSNALGDGAYTNSAPNNWTSIAVGSAGFGTEDPVDGEFSGSAGDNTAQVSPSTMGYGQMAYINLDNVGSPNIPASSGTLTSAASLGTITNSTLYTLTVAMGSRADAVDAPDVMISLLANGVTVASAQAHGANGTSGLLLTKGSFVDLSASFTTSAVDLLAGQNLTISLSASGPGGSYTSYPQANFANVRLEATDVVPEPASIGLLSLAGISLLARRRR